MSETSFRSGSTPEVLSPDRLGREPLARQLAASLQQQERNSTVVIGLSGEWGSGKSWLIAKMREALDADYQQSIARASPPRFAPYVMEFKVWQWSGTSEITSQFFDQLGEAVRVVLDAEKAKNQSVLQEKVFGLWPVQLCRRLWNKLSKTSTPEKLSAYAAWFEAHGPVVKGYNIGFVGLLGTLTFLSGAEFFQKPDWLSLLQATLLAILTFANGLLSLLADLFSKKADVKKKWAEANKQSPQALKEDLKRRMKNLSYPIAVILDDLDRLTASEIAHVIQLVKTQADFPNVYYILGFDRRLIASALEREAPGVPINGLPHNRGEEFLEKIVPVIFDLPPIDTAEIRNVLCADLEQLFGLKYHDSLRFNNLWSRGLSPFIQTLRDADRLFNTLKFNFHLTCNVGLREALFGEFDVDTLDFVVVEILRLFEPEVFRLIAQHRDLLTRDRAYERININNAGQNGPDTERYLSELRPIYEKAKERRGTIFLLRHLFPELESLLRAESEGSVNREGGLPGYAPRVCEAVYFLRYFSYGIKAEDWSAKEVSEIVNAIEIPIDFAQKFQAVADGEYPTKEKAAIEEAKRSEPDDVQDKRRWNRTIELCDLVGKRVADLEYVKTLEAIQSRQRTSMSLLKAGMVLPKRNYHVTSQNMERQMAHHTYFALRSISDSEKRAEVTLSLLDDVTNFATNSQLILAEFGNHRSNSPHSLVNLQKFLLLNPAQLETAKITIARKVHEATMAGLIWKRPQARLYLELIDLWGDNDTRDARNVLLASMPHDPAKCFQLLEAFLEVGEKIPLGSDRNYSQTYLLLTSAAMGAKGLDSYIPLSALEAQFPILESWFANHLADFGSVPSLAQNPTLYRQLLCWMGLTNYIQKKANPLAEVKIETEGIRLLLQARTSNAAPH